MRLKLTPATPEDAEAIAALRNAVSDDLTFKHGKGPWTTYCTTDAVLSDLRNARLYIALHRDEVIASLKLATPKTGAIDLKFLPKAKSPLYLTALTVAPEHQRRGLGRACLEQAAALARKTKADTLVLDAYDHPAAGAGPFYAKCGCRETGRTVYRSVPLIYYTLAL